MDVKSYLTSSFDAMIVDIHPVTKLEVYENNAARVCAHNLDLIHNPTLIHEATDTSIAWYLNKFLIEHIFNHPMDKGSRYLNIESSIYYTYREALNNIITMYAGKYLPIYILYRLQRGDYTSLNINDLCTIIRNVQRSNCDLLGKLLCLATILLIDNKLPYEDTSDKYVCNSLNSIIIHKFREVRKTRMAHPMDEDKLGVKDVIVSTLVLENPSWNSLSTDKLVDHYANRAKHILFKSWLVYFKNPNIKTRITKERTHEDLIIERT